MSLKRELESASSPMRVTLERLLPGLPTVMRGPWKAALAGREPVFDPALPPDVLGHAISERIGWAFAGLELDTMHGASELVRAGADWAVVDSLGLQMIEVCRGENPHWEARIACLVGLADRAMRSGRVEEPWYAPLLRARELREAVDAVDAAWVADLLAVTELATPALASLAGNVVRAPVFAGSRAVRGADGDLVIGRVLLEVKSSRRPELAKRDLQQVVSYALLDWDDRYQLEEVAILAARFGVLVRWPLEALVKEASGGRLELAAARAQLQDVLAPHANARE